MKKNLLRNFIFLLAFSFAPFIAEAQFGALKNRVKNRVKNKIENKVDKAVDDVLDGKPIKRNESGQDDSGGQDAGETQQRRDSRPQTNGAGQTSETDEAMRYKYEQIIRDCASFLDFEGGQAFMSISRGEDFAECRKKMTPQLVNSLFSTDRNSRNYMHGLADCREHVNQSGFEEAAFQELDRTYMRFDKNEAHERLVELSNDFAFIKRVLVPNNSSMTEVTSYAKKLADKLGKKNDAALSSKTSSAFHKENVNKIFFTSNPNINPATATEKDFKTNFKAGEDIYGVVYFDDKIAEITANSGRILYGGIEVNNNGTGSTEIDYNGNLDKQKSYSVFVIYADADRYKNKTGSTFPTVSINADLLSSLPPRTVNVVATVGRDCSGSFKFDASNNSQLERIASTAKILRQRITANKGLPKAGMRNAGIEKQLVNMFNSIGWSEKFKKAIITSSDYGYKRVAGRITGRTLMVVMLSKKSDGTCMYQDFTVIQPKTASGYGSFKRLSTGSQSDIGCDKF